MKCDYCGANLTIDDKVCPYCHKPNRYYEKHRQDMFHYETDYQNTKSDVYEKAGKTSKRAARIAVLAVMGMLILAAVLLNVYAWDIRRAFEERAARKHLPAHTAQLDQYLEEQDWMDYYQYMSENNLLYYDLGETFKSYQRFAYLADDYTQIYQMCTRLVTCETMGGDYYYTSDRCLESMSDVLEEIYNFTREDPYSIYYEVYENHRDWCDPVIEQAQQLIQAYVGVDKAVFEDQSIRSMSDTKILVLLERSYEQDE